MFYPVDGRGSRPELAGTMPRPTVRAPRNAPTQRRSRERLARIARAAGELCAQLGADAVTMEAIAERAETSIGSLYRFYPNRDALLHAVAERYVADLAELLDRDDGSAAEVAALPLGDLVNAMLDPFEAFQRTHPGYFAILFAPQGSSALRAIRGRLRERLAERLEAIIRVRVPRMNPQKRRRVSLAAVEAARALLQFIDRSVPRAEQAAMRAELRAMLVAYLAPHLGDG